MIEPRHASPEPHGSQPFAFHPVLFAAYPVLFLYSVNVAEVDFAEVLVPLGAVVGLGTAAFLLARLIVRETARAALLTSVGLIAFLGYGHIRSLVAPTGLRGGWFLVVFVAIVVIAAGLTLLARRVPGKLTTGLNVASIGLILAAVVPVSGDIVASVGPPAIEPGTIPVTAGDRTTDRDIYYIVLDRYASRHGLETYYDITEPRLYGYLEQAGFEVIDHAMANYLRTAHSLTSTVHMRYLDAEAARYGPGPNRIGTIKPLMQDHPVGRFLQAQGYTYYHLGSWWDATEANLIADVNPRVNALSDFVAALVDTTAIPVIQRRLARFGITVGATETTERERAYSTTVAELNELTRIAAAPGKKFVFAHILLPHKPYVFNPDGSYVTAEEEESRERVERYARQLEYADSKMIEFLDQILSVPEQERPIVLMQADEGPYPVQYENRPTVPWTEATDADLDEKFGILAAYYLPDFPGSAPYPGITPVNSFRLILGGYFGADLPLLPDRHIIYTDAYHPFDFADYTDRMKRIASETGP